MSDNEDPNYDWAIDLIYNHGDELVSRLLDLRGQVETLTEKNVELTEKLSNENEKYDLLNKIDNLGEVLKPLVNFGEERLKIEWDRHTWEIVREAQKVMEE